MKQAQLQDNAKGSHDIHDRLQDGSWPAGHVGAGRTRWLHRRRLAGAALAGAHSPRHVRERLGHDGHDPVARDHSGRRDELNPSKEERSWIFLWDMASIQASEATLAAMREGGY